MHESKNYYLFICVLSPAVRSAVYLILSKERAQILDDLLHLRLRVVGLVLKVGHSPGELRALGPQLLDCLVLQLALAQLVVLPGVLQVVPDRHRLGLAQGRKLGQLSRRGPELRLDLR